jgi:Domain of unknown function (DUF1877)
MSITGLLKQISSHTLERVNETRSLLDLFQGIAPVDEAPKIDNLYGLSSERISLLREILSDPEQVVGEWTLWDFVTLENWKADYPEDFDALKADLYQIVVEGKVASSLDLGKGWHVISYIFTGSSSMEILPFLVDETEDNLKVNAILCGQPLDGDGSLRYLKTAEVQELSEALSRLSDELIHQRIDEKMSAQPNTYLWMGESDEEVLYLCREVQEFYNSAANRGNAMLISIV